MNNVHARHELKFRRGRNQKKHSFLIDLEHLFVELREEEQRSSPSEFLQYLLVFPGHSAEDRLHSHNRSPSIQRTRHRQILSLLCLLLLFFTSNTLAAPIHIGLSASTVISSFFSIRTLSNELRFLFHY